MKSGPIRILDGFPNQRIVFVPPHIVKQALLEPVTRDLFPTHIGRFDIARHHYVSRPHGTSEHILIVCIDGVGYCQFGKNKWRLERGRAVILPPNRAHRYMADGDLPWTIYWVHFRGHRAEEYAQMLGMGPQRVHFAVDSLERVMEAFEEIYGHVLGGYSTGDLIAMSTSHARLLGLCRVHQRSTALRQRHIEERVLKVIRHMHAHMKEALSLDEMARAAGWSAPHFCSVFGRQIKIPPMEYFSRLRLHKAAHLLNTTDLRIKEVAAATGFADPFYFSRAFSRHHGMSPQCYRLKNQSVASDES